MAVIGDAESFFLSIETAIGGGSLALFKGDRLVDRFSGSASTSRAEDLLPNVHELLRANSLRKSDLSRIVASTGPGSYTGLRIGIATVLGLGKALGIESVGIPLFTSISSLVIDDQAYVIAVPMGRNDICFEVKCSVVAGKRLEIGRIENIRSTVSTNRCRRMLVHSDLVEVLTTSLLADVEVTDLGRNMAEYVGRAALVSPLSTTLTPIYVQNPRFN